MFKPRVYLVGKTKINSEEIKKFISVETDTNWFSDGDSDAEIICELAGRLCYMSFAHPRPGGNSAYLKNIKESAHGSVLEHASWNLIITNVSRSLTHELVRHRAGMSYSQLSQRYVDESDTTFVEPPMIINDANLHQCWLNAVQRTQKAYQELVAGLERKLAMTGDDDEKSPADKRNLRKLIRQTARSLLPNATETKIFVTMNARAARHFLELRSSRQADMEIRTLANEIYEILAQDSPELFNDYQKIPLEDGTFELVTQHKKI